VTATEAWPVCGSLVPPYRHGDQTGKMPRLLYVDRNIETLIGFTALLAMSGYVPLSMQSPLVALDVVSKIPLNLAVLNYDLSGMNGLELARQIRQARPALTILLLLDHCPATEALPAVVNHCLPKVADLRRMLKSIDHYLGKRAAA
jgi:CheY-like chemotaxis protein